MMNFRFRPVLTIALLAALGVLVSLGTWQMQRLAWKRALIEMTEARVAAEPVTFTSVYRDVVSDPDRDFSYTPVEVRGRFRHDLEAHLFGSLDGAPGFYIFTPLRLATTQGDDDTAFVYVNRGFVPQAAKSQEARMAGIIDGLVVVRGLLRMPSSGTGLAKALRPANDPDTNIWHERSPAVFAAAAQINALPVYIDSFGEENPGPLPKGGTTRLDFSNRHLQYALTWYGLALTLIGVFVAFSVSRRD